MGDAFVGIDFLSVGNSHRQNKQLLRVLGEENSGGCSRVGDETTKGKKVIRVEECS